MISIRVPFTSIYFYFSSCDCVKTTGKFPRALILKYYRVLMFNGSTVPHALPIHGYITPMYPHHTRYQYIWLWFYILYDCRTAPVDAIICDTPVINRNSVLQDLPITPGFLVSPTYIYNFFVIFCKWRLLPKLMMWNLYIFPNELSCWGFLLNIYFKVMNYDTDLIKSGPSFLYICTLVGFYSENSYRYTNYIIKILKHLKAFKCTCWLYGLSPLYLKN